MPTPNIYIYLLFWVWGETWPGHVLDRHHEIHPERSPAIWHQWQLSQHFINFSPHTSFRCSITDWPNIHHNNTHVHLWYVSEPFTVILSKTTWKMWPFHLIVQLIHNFSSFIKVIGFEYIVGSFVWILQEKFCHRYLLRGSLSSSTLSIESKWMNADQGLSTPKKTLQ